MTALLRRPEADHPVGDRAELDRLRSETVRLTAELARSEAERAVLETLCNEDAVTGLLNRRGFMRDLSRAISFTRRYDVTAAMLLLDLNAFKPINDRHGHLAGDLALKHVAEVLKTNLRGSDSIGRLGGDEFGILLWQADAEVGRGKADALEAALTATPFQFDGYRLTVTGSIGSTAVESGDNEESVTARADKAMYVRKTARVRSLLDSASIRR